MSHLLFGNDEEHELNSRTSSAKRSPLRTRHGEPIFPSTISESNFKNVMKSIQVCSIRTFFKNRSLLMATLDDKTMEVYSLAFEYFQEFVRYELNPDFDTIDAVVEDYVNLVYDTDQRAAARTEMTYLLSVFYILFPGQKTTFGRTARALTGWKISKPPKSATPLSRTMVMAYAAKLLLSKRTSAATILLLCYGACLRVGEALKLKWEHVALPGDPRLSAFPPGTAGVNILDAKTSKRTGRLQFVPIQDDIVIQFLRKIHDNPSPDEALAPHIDYQSYSKYLKEATSYFQISNVAIRSHSARIGRALDEYVNGARVDQIAILGRWASLSTLRLYLDNGKAWMLDMKTTPLTASRFQSRTALMMTNLDSIEIAPEAPPAQKKKTIKSKHAPQNTSLEARRATPRAVSTNAHRVISAIRKSRKRTRGTRARP